MRAQSLWKVYFFAQIELTAAYLFSIDEHTQRGMCCVWQIFTFNSRLIEINSKSEEIC